MIGIICREGDRSAVREFFELFKTPWAFYEPGAAYDAILASGPCLDERLDAKLVLLFSSAPSPDDAALGLEPCGRAEPAVLESDGIRLPLYCGALGLDGVGTQRGTLAGTDQPAIMESKFGSTTVLRCGYDLFSEITFLLTKGQPIVHAQTPSLDLHIALVRRCILAAGVALVEIPPVAPGHRLLACLTHDVDFLGIRRHRLDRTIAGFLYRASVGSAIDVIKGRRTVKQMLRNWLAVLMLPLVYAGVLDDFWLPFDQYARLEAECRSTFFLIPFAGRPGRPISGSAVARTRAVRYGVSDAAALVRDALEHGSEIGVHGIDAWNDEAAARVELEEVARYTRSASLGVRMHWLYFAPDSFAKLEQAGFSYDSTVGYNECVGFRAGTAQVYRPLAASTILELPLHIQDTALFYPSRMYCREQEATRLACAIVDRVGELGGVVTVSWHERSLAPERQWQTPYIELLRHLRRSRASVRTSGEIVDWFRTRRAVDLEGVHFDSTVLRNLGQHRRQSRGDEHGLLIRIHHSAETDRHGGGFSDVPIDRVELEQLLNRYESPAA